MIRSLLIFALLFSSSVGCNDAQINPTESAVQTTRGVESIDERVKRIVALQMGLDESKFDLSDGLQADLGADDLDMVELVMELEDEFSISIPDSSFFETENPGPDGRIPEAFSGSDLARIVREQLDTEK